MRPNSKQLSYSFALILVMLLFNACSEQSMVTTAVEKPVETVSVENGILVFPSSESFQTLGNTSSFNPDLYDFETLNEGGNNSDKLRPVLYQGRIEKEEVDANQPITISPKLAAMLNKDGMVIIGNDVLRMTRDFVFKTDRTRIEELKNLEKLSLLATNFINTAQKQTANGSIRQTLDNIEIIPVMRSSSEEPCDQIGGELGDPCNNDDGPGSGGNPGSGGSGTTQNNYIDIANDLYNTETHVYHYHHERRLVFKTVVELNYFSIVVESYSENDRRRNQLFGAAWDDEEANLLNVGAFKILLQRRPLTGPFIYLPYDATIDPMVNTFNVATIQTSALVNRHSLMNTQTGFLDTDYRYKTEDIQSIHYLFEERGNDTFRIIRRTQLQRIDYSHAF